MGLFGKVLGFFKAEEEQAPQQKPGRNDPCWCGSGQKYKKCHLPADEKRAAKAACNVNCGPT